MKQGDLFGSGAAPASPAEPTQSAPPSEPLVSHAAPVPAAPVAVSPTPVTLAHVNPAPLVPAAVVHASVGSAPTGPAHVAPRPPEPAVTKTVLTVGELTRSLKVTLERAFRTVLVRGEVSGFRGPNGRGHLYFALKDGDASIDVKLWQSKATRLKFGLKDGLEVVIEGALDLYAPQGRYSIIIERIEPAGVGALALAFEQLKERLSAEGLFGPKRVKPRRPLPFLPRRIGVVTSLSGAAWKDFLKVLHRRHPHMAVLVHDARVQGDGAAGDIIRALKALARTDVDVIVVTRGGGSIEDLWTFNEEAVVRAIFTCPVPVVSAVGHEVDVTLADLVADYRAPTPSAAAEVLAPVLAELVLALKVEARRLEKAWERRHLTERSRLSGLKGKLTDPRRVLSTQRLTMAEYAERMSRQWRGQLRGHREGLKAYEQRLQKARPQAKLDATRRALSGLRDRLQVAAVSLLRGERQRWQTLAVRWERASVAPRVVAARVEIGGLKQRLVPLVRARLKGQRQLLAHLGQTMDALSPLKVLGRGYSLTFSAGDGHLLRSARSLAVGDVVRVRLSEDELEAAVTAINKLAK